MTRSITRMSAAVAAGTALAAFGLPGTTVTSAAAQASRPVASLALTAAHPLAVSGSQLWVRRYRGAGDHSDEARSVAASPNGGRVFVTGASTSATSGRDYLTVAYNAATGARMWAARYDGPGNAADEAESVAVSPDGASVFVTGHSAATGQRYDSADYATIAYRASDGKQLWVARYNGPARRTDGASAVAVARDGAAVFVTGGSEVATDKFGYATVAYNAATGVQLWARRYVGPDYASGAEAIASPGGNRVFVTGYSRGGGAEASYATVAYNAATGARLWVQRYHGSSGAFDYATSLAANLHQVFVTGTAWVNYQGADYATIAYNAATGTRLWVRLYDDPGHANDGGSDIAVSPDGASVFVTGSSETTPNQYRSAQYATVAYQASDGKQLWTQRYDGPGSGRDEACAVVSPSNGKVYVTGTSAGRSTTRNDYATVAYSAVTGAQLWVKRYNGPASGGDYASALAARAGAVFVTGSSHGTASNPDYATIAYKG